MEAILSSVRCFHGEKYIALATASSGIAATLLSLGRTFHSRFKVPVVEVITSDINFHLKPNTAEAKVCFTYLSRSYFLLGKLNVTYFYIFKIIF